MYIMHYIYDLMLKAQKSYKCILGPWLGDLLVLPNLSMVRRPIVLKIYPWLGSHLCFSMVWRPSVLQIYPWLGDLLCCKFIHG